jgi:hypothetical protein
VEWRHQGGVPSRQPRRHARFRTFLRSADPKVRQSNELFLPTLTPARELFANDVIFLGDAFVGARDEVLRNDARLVSKFGGG